MNVTLKFSKVAHHFNQDWLGPYIIEEVTEASLARFKTDKGVVLKSKIYTKYLKHYRSSEDISAVTNRKALQPLTQPPDAADIEDEDDEEVNLRELDTMEGSTQSEDDIDNLFQDDNPSSVIENIEFKFPISPVGHSSLEEREEVSVSESVDEHMEKMMHLAKGLDEKVFFKRKHDATDIEDEDDEEVDLKELHPMEDSTQAEEYIDNLFQDDDPSTVIENVELKFPISPVADSSLEEREEVSVSESVEEHMEKMMHLPKGLDKKVQDNILKSQKKERERVRQQTSFLPGDVVLKMNVTPKFTKVAHHFDQDWLGPYIIKEVTETSLARIKTDKGVVLKSKIHTKYLKHYRSSEDISAVTNRQALQPVTQPADATDIEDEDDEEVNLRDLYTMEDTTQAEEDIDNLFQDDDPSTVTENAELKFPITPVADSSLEEREEVSVSEFVEDHTEKMMHLPKGLDEKVQENILKSQKKGGKKSKTANVFLTW